MQILNAAIATGAAGALVFGLASPVNASKDIVIDVKNDAPARMGITKAKFSHTKRGVRAKIKVDNLRRRGEFVLAVANRRNSRRYGLTVTGHRNRKPTKKFYKCRHKLISHKRCKGTRVG